MRASRAFFADFESISYFMNANPMSLRISFDSISCYPRSIYSTGFDAVRGSLSVPHILPSGTLASPKQAQAMSDQGKYHAYHCDFLKR